MRISGVIALYNKAPTVLRAVQSMLCQTRPLQEIVIVDDGSTDGGGGLVKNLCGPNFRVLRQSNAGVSAARNRGIEEAMGELIAFLDADDEWKPDFIARIEHLAERFPKAGIFATGYEFVKDGVSTRCHPAGLPKQDGWQGLLPSYFRTMAQDHMPFCTGCVAVPVDVFRRFGGFLTGAHWGEDAEMWARIALSYGLAYDSEPSSLYHLSLSGRATNRGDPRPMFPVVHTLQRALAEGRVSAPDRQAVESYIAKAIRNSVQTNLLHGHRALAAQQLRELNAYPHDWITAAKYRLLCLIPGWGLQAALAARRLILRGDRGLDVGRPNPGRRRDR